MKTMFSGKSPSDNRQLFTEIISLFICVSTFWCIDKERFYFCGSDHKLAMAARRLSSLLSRSLSLPPAFASPFLSPGHFSPPLLCFFFIYTSMLISVCVYNFPEMFCHQFKAWCVFFFFFFIIKQIMVGVYISLSVKPGS